MVVNEWILLYNSRDETKDQFRDQGRSSSVLSC